MQYYSTEQKRKVPQRASRNAVTTDRHTAINQKPVTTQAALPPLPDVSEDERMYTTKSATPQSVIRRQPSHMAEYLDENGERVIYQNGKRIVIHQGKLQKAKRRLHWFVPTGITMLAMIVLWRGGTWAVNTIQQNNINATYGFPRTYQTDANVGHGTGKSHFLFENLNGHVFFEEIPEGTDFKDARVYMVTTLYGPDASQVPVTAEFKDVNGDGKMDVLIDLEGQQIVYLNTGTGFKAE